MPAGLWPRVTPSRSLFPFPLAPAPGKGHPGLGSTLLGFIKTRSQNVEMYKNGELLPASGCVHAGVWRACEGGWRAAGAGDGRGAAWAAAKELEEDEEEELSRIWTLAPRLRAMATRAATTTRGGEPATGDNLIQ